MKFCQTLIIGYLQPTMNGLDFEGRRFKVKVTARSVGTPYLLNGLNISHI